MAKYFGKVLYATYVETTPGVWEEQIIPREYYGDVRRQIVRTVASENLNDDIRLNNEISVLADAFANEHFADIRAVEYAGTFWKVTSVSAEPPRIVLFIGGVYNGPTPPVPTDS